MGTTSNPSLWCGHNTRIDPEVVQLTCSLLLHVSCVRTAGRSMFCFSARRWTVWLQKASAYVCVFIRRLTHGLALWLNHSNASFSQTHTQCHPAWITTHKQEINNGSADAMASYSSALPELQYNTLACPHPSRLWANSRQSYRCYFPCRSDFLFGGSG